MNPTRTRTITLAASGALLFAGCAASNTDSASRTPAPVATPVETTGDLVTRAGSITIDHDAWRELGYRWDWSARPQISDGANLARLDVHDDLVVTQDTLGVLSALETPTGKLRWSVGVADTLTRFLGTGRVGDQILSYARPSLFVLDANSGNLLARQPMDVVVSTEPVIYNGILVFGTPTGEVYAHEFASPSGKLRPPPMNTGARAWGYMIPGAVEADPVMVGNLIGVVSQAGTVFFVDPFTGAGLGRGNIWEGLDNNPVTDGERLFAASLDQSVYAFAPDGSLVWRYPTARRLRAQPSVWLPTGDAADSVLIVDIPGEGLTAFAGPTGQKLWVNDSVQGEVIATRDGNLVAWNGRELLLLDASTGDVITAVPLRGVQGLRASAFDEADLYAIGTDGTVAKFTPRQ